MDKYDRLQKDENTYPKLLEQKYDITQYKSKQDIRRLTYIYTEHSTLKAFAHKTLQADSPTCQLCNLEAETTELFLPKCPALARTRYQILGYTCSTLNTTLNSRTPGTILTYISQTNRLPKGQYTSRPP